MLTMICGHCGQQLNIPEKFAGQKGTCKHCQAPITAPVAPGTETPPERAEEFSGFTIMHDDHTQPTYTDVSKRPQTTIKKVDRAPREINWVFLAILGGILLIGGGIVVVSFVYANMTGTIYTDEAAPALANPDFVSPIAGKSVDEALAYLSSYKQLSWREIDGNNVYLGWNFTDFPKSGPLSMRTAENTANIASMALTGETTVYLLDASVAAEGWHPGGAGLKFQVSYLQGEITTKKSF